jgi:metal-dependent amidase/aminoacylase/carboxypeptidase family protein
VLDQGLVDRLAAEVDHELVALRSRLHQRPELAGDERRTAASVVEALAGAEVTVSTGVAGHGVVAVVDGAGPGPTVAYRADLDAVPVGGPGEAAHLCGHDVHTAVGVGIVRTMARLRHRFHGRVVVVFQPAEETFEGARAMIEDGLLDRLPPDEFYALHCCPLPVGTFGVLPGTGQPGQDIGYVDVAGPGATTVAERVIGAVDGLSTVRRPESDVEFGRMLDQLRQAGGPLARFVFAVAYANPRGEDALRVHISVRAWPDDRYPELRAEVRRLVAAVCDAPVEYPDPPLPAMVCSAPLSLAAADQLATVASEVLVFHAAYPFNGDDFAMFLNRVPGAMVYLGVSNVEAGIIGVPHAPDFAADDRAIGYGVRGMSGLLWSRLHALG